MTIQQATPTRQEDGQDVDVWADEVTVWAEVLGLGGRETRKGEQIVSEHDYRVTIRYRDGVTSDKRLTWRGRTLEIAEPPSDPEGRRVELVLMCKETAGAGA